MMINRTVAVITLFGLVGLGIIFMFDPTHDYPTIEVEVDLLPGENATINIPTTSSSFMKWAGTLIADPYLWIQTNVDGLEMFEFAKLLLSDIQFGFPIKNYTITGTVTIINIKNITITATIMCILAPSPNALGSSKTWWYIALAFAQTLIGAGIAIFSRKANNVRSYIRKPSSNSLAGSTILSTSKHSISHLFRPFLDRIHGIFDRKSVPTAKTIITPPTARV